MRCKNCKQTFEPVKFNQKYCLETECVKVWIEAEKIKQWKKRKTKLKTELLTVQDYIKIAQQIFNKYIRLKSRGGYCISCGNELKEKFDAGHYLNANNHWAVRFDERNVWSQCVECNQYKHGNLIEYRKTLVKHFGEKWIEQLEKDGKKTKKYTIDELKDIISEYKKKVKELEIGK